MSDQNENTALKKSEREAIKKLASKWDLVEVILFGSKATGKYNNDSDFDFAVLRWEDFSTDEWLELYRDFMKILQTEKIDLIDLKTKHDIVLIWEIYSKGKVIYEKKEGFFIEKGADAYIDYIDYRKLYSEEERSKILKAAIYEMEK